MHREFEKCRHSAQEWFSVYKDPHFDPATKEDILKEDVIEFFFSMNKKVVAVQKNFFLLAMIEQQLSANLPLSEEQRTAKIAKLRIITLAKEQGLTPSYKDQNTTAPADSNMQRLWYFGDERNFLQSSDEGLNDEQALDYLLD